jgi:membrane associated rhomboid family serine protease
MDNMEPTTTTTVLGFALSKVYYSLSALFMAMVVLFLKKNPTLPGHGKVATGAIVGGVSVGSAVIFGGAIAVWLGKDPNDLNTALAIGGAIGLVAWFVIYSLVKYLDKLEDKNIVEAAKAIKEDIQSIKG